MDARMRELERAAELGDRAAIAALERERYRAQAFARDPRRDPRRGDEIAVAGVARSVDRLWPAHLLDRLLVDPVGRGVGSDAFDSRTSIHLDPGTLIEAPPSWRNAWRNNLPGDRGQPVPRIWTFRASRDRGATWEALESFDWQGRGVDVSLVLPPDVTPTAVTWTWCRGPLSRSAAEKTSTIDAWRRWARKADVLRVAP